MESNLAFTKENFLKLQIEREQYRYAATAWKEQALKLPPVDMKRIEWSKPSKNDKYFTTRSLVCQKRREQMQKKYNNSDGIILKNNEWETYKYDDEELKIFQSFVDENEIGNTDPKIRVDEAWKLGNEVLGIRKVVNAPKKLQETLRNQKECYAKIDLAANTVIGQYIGNEILESQWYELFNGTDTEKEHMTYRFGAPINETQFMEIDAYSAYKDQMNSEEDNSFLLRLNDGRINIFKPATNSDKKRINCRFVSVLANGWPLILVQTTKKVEAGRALWIEYGPNYGGVLNEIHTINDQKNKMAAHSNLILNNIDLKIDEPFSIDLISRNVKEIKLKTIDMDDTKTNKSGFEEVTKDIQSSTNTALSNQKKSRPIMKDKYSSRKRKARSDLVRPLKKQKVIVDRRRGKNNGVRAIVSLLDSEDDKDSAPEFESWLGGIKQKQGDAFNLKAVVSNNKLLKMKEQLFVRHEYVVRIRYIPPHTDKSQFISEMEHNYAIKILYCSNFEIDDDYSPYLVAHRVELVSKEMRKRLLTLSNEGSMGNKPSFNNRNRRRQKSSKNEKTEYDLKNPYKEGWLWKQSRHLKKWRRRWVVIQSDYLYTFERRKQYENPTEIISLKSFTDLSKEITYTEPPNIAQSKFANFKKKFKLHKQQSQNNEQNEQEAMFLILLSDLNNDQTFIFKAYSQKSQTDWIYSCERSLEYRSNLLQNIIPSDIIKYIVSLYFLSFERIKLAKISTYFCSLFDATNYNVQYHYYQDAIYWSKHFRTFCKAQYVETKRHKNIKNDIFDEEENENKNELTLDEQQFNECSFHLSSKDWSRFTKNERFQLKYFFIFYHEFSALNYQKLKKRKSDFDSVYIRSRAKKRTHHRRKEHKHNKKNHKNGKTHSHKSKNKKHKNVRDQSRRHSEDEYEYDSADSNLSEISSICGDNEVVTEEIIDALKALDTKYENIRLDGHEWNDFFNEWISYPFIESLFVHCNIQTLHIGAARFYDESSSMMTQIVNNAIDLNIHRSMTQKQIINMQQYERLQSTFWDRAGLDWFTAIIKHSYALTSHLSTIRNISLRDSNLTDSHLICLCDAINSNLARKSLTIRKLNLSKNKLTDASMKYLFLTIGDNMQFLEELVLNDLSLTDEIAQIMIDFYFEYHHIDNRTQLYSLSLLGNLFSFDGFKAMNTLFERELIDEAKFIDGHRKIFHVGVNGRADDIKRFKFDPRLHIVVANTHGRLSDA